MRRVRPMTALLVLALSATAVLAVLDLVLAENDRSDVQANRVVPTGGSDVEWRDDGVYVKGEKQLDAEPTGEPAETAAPARKSTPPAGSLDRSIGQKIVSRMSGTVPGSALLERVRAGRVGGVILFADNIRSPSQVRSTVDALQAAARSGGNPPLLVAVDQEGGTVKRFGSLPPSASAATMGANGSAGGEGAATAAALRDVGVTVNLAPVADVPQVQGSFLGSRAFGRSASAVARSACAFAEGLSAGGVAPTLKHFPGVGTATANTDFDAVTITAPAAAIRAGYAPYERCAGSGLVMVSNARYANLTGSQPAVVSAATYNRELALVGFDGVTISDDLEAAAVSPIPELAVKASSAGLDLLLYARTEQGAVLAHTQMRRAVADGRLSAAGVRTSARKIRELKSELAG